jgi:hypothetical protein
MLNNLVFGKFSFKQKIKLSVTIFKHETMKKIISLILFSMLAITMTAQHLKPEEVVQSNLEAYNNLDIDSFMFYISDDIEIFEFEGQKLSVKGKEQCKNLYADLFEKSPSLHSRILKRIVFDNKVIDHEFITGRRGSDVPIELVLIYEVKGEKIFRITVMRK